MRPLIVLAAVVALLVPWASATIPGRAVIDVRERLVATYTEGGQPASDETWKTQVTTRTGKVIGYSATACDFVEADSRLRQCTGTYSLPEGRLSVMGLVLSRNAYVMAVVGGTGLYDGKVGDLQVRLVGTSRQVTFRIH